jgi:hypothetical protein
MYLDTNADRWDHKIVLHTPIFPKEPSAVVALQCLDLENMPGLVIAGPPIILRGFSKNLKELDEKEQWGKLEVSDLVDKIWDLASDLELSIVYVQNC